MGDADRQGTETTDRTTDTTEDTDIGDETGDSPGRSRRDVVAALLAAGGVGVLGSRPARAATGSGANAAAEHWEESDSDGLLEAPDHDGIDVGTVQAETFGTATDTVLEGIANGDRFLRVAPVYSGVAPTIVAGYSGNVEGIATGAVIGGGGQKDPVLQDEDNGANEVYDNFTTVAGGRDNQAGEEGIPEGTPVGPGATVSGGESNRATGELSTIGGGHRNEVTGDYTTVSGGSNNDAFGRASTIGGGSDNKVSGGATVAGGSKNDASGLDATIAGGEQNEATGNDATVGGGTSNTASGDIATVGGGKQNVASGGRATIPGGAGNVADGKYSFATGREAVADGNDGAVVFGDSTWEEVNPDRSDQFVVQAGGGAKLYSSSDLSTGVELPAGSGSWSSVSTQTAKTSVSPADPQAVLDGVESLDVSTWEYDSQEDATHMGPMAEEFADTFGLGADRERIANVDADGVALGAIQGLAERLEDETEELREENDQLRAENEALRERCDDLEARLDALESAVTE